MMRVAEAEFAFRLARGLPSRQTPYEMDEVLDAVESLHLAIEIPDSRFEDFTRVGASQLIADIACACWVMIGEPAPDWRSLDLSRHRVLAFRNGQPAAEGSGANVLGDPRRALTWIANELRTHDSALQAADVVITGTCVPPLAIGGGDHVRMDFGELGQIEARFVM